MTTKAESKSGLAHCCHHGEHWEFCFDFDKRAEYIKNNKPQGEQELRLKLFQIIPDELTPGKCSPEWEAYNKAWEVRDEAWEAYDKAERDYDKAREAYDKAERDYDKAREAYTQAWGKELMELHDKMFPDCPWDGETIFKK